VPTDSSIFYFYKVTSLSESGVIPFMLLGKSFNSGF